jgi:hypothetical protein
MSSDESRNGGELSPQSGGLRGGLAVAVADQGDHLTGARRHKDYRRFCGGREGRPHKASWRPWRINSPWRKCDIHPYEVLVCEICGRHLKLRASGTAPKRCRKCGYPEGVDPGVLFRKLMELEQQVADARDDVRWLLSQSLAANHPRYGAICEKYGSKQVWYD